MVWSDDDIPLQLLPRLELNFTREAALLVLLLAKCLCVIITVVYDSDFFDSLHVEEHFEVSD